MSTRKLLVGFFKVVDPSTTPEGSILWAPPDDPGWTPEQLGSRKLVAHLNPQEKHFASEDAARDYIAHCASVLAERGLKPTAFSWGEEWYLGGTKDWDVWEGKTGFAWRDAVKTRVDRAIVLMKQQWPNAYSLQIETLYNDVKLFGPSYYAPAYACDVLALDPYMFAKGAATWHTDEWPLTAATHYEKFYLEIGRIYEHVAQSYSQPIVMIPQAFREPDPESLWAVAPTAQQLRWWFDLAQRLPKVIAICWFALRSHEGMVGLEQMPAQLAEVQRECREMGYAT